MRILITTDSYYPDVNGASVFGQTLAAHLLARGHEVAVVAPGMSVRPTVTTLQGETVYGVASVPVGFYRGFRIAVPFGLRRAAERIITSFRPDVIHAQGHFTVSKAMIRHARRLGLPVVGTNHFMPENLAHYAHLPAAFDARLQRVMWRQFRQVYEHVDLVTTPTATAARYMRGNGFDPEVRVISNGIDLERFSPSQATAGFRTRYGLPDMPLLLYVGRLDLEKNLDLVLRALALVTPDVPIHFAVAGRGARRRALQRLARRMRIEEAVTFLGFLPGEDLPALYAEAHCFVMAGTAELQSIATLEAMASGLPVLAVSAMALPELVHPTVNGYLFEPGNPEMLALQLRAVFTDRDLQRRMAQASAEIIRRHALGRTLEEFEAAYAALAGTVAARGMESRVRHGFDFGTPADRLRPAPSSRSRRARRKRVAAGSGERGSLTPDH